MSAAKGNFRQSMLWLHTWAGLVVATVLYFMFITGSVGYFNDEITYWMQPEIPQAAEIDQQQLLNVAEQRLNKVAPDSLQWWVDFPIGRFSALAIYWTEKSKDKDGKMVDKWHDEVLNLDTGEPLIVRKTGGGRTLYRMHYALHYMPTVLAYWLTSLCSMFMLVGLITGIVIHKQIFKDFFTFRPGKKQHSWRDMHNVLSVLPLPFHLMITYSGLLFLMYTTMPGLIGASYGVGEVNKDRFYEAVYSQGEAHKDFAGVAAENISLSSILPDVDKQIGQNNIAYIGIENRGDINAHIEVSQYGYDGLSDGKSFTYNAVTAELEHSSQGSESSSAAMTFRDTMTILHEGKFSGYLLRWLYFISGLMGAGMIASGMILWASKRRERAQKKGLASKGLIFVERINIGTLVGLPIGIAVYFWLNRLLPASFEGREHWEINGLFISWAVMLAYPYFLAGKRSTTQMWVDQLAVATMLFGLLPMLNFLTTEVHLANSLVNGNWVLAGFDFTMLLFSGCFGLAAYRMHGKQEVTPIIATVSAQNIHMNNVTRTTNEARL
ncbi:MAG: PepSY domain-containing protein [Gammaproteobacteria bacterium]|nr:PepSY domain-containing protein [Gammaproteobacteria bacterium]